MPNADFGYDEIRAMTAEAIEGAGVEAILRRRLITGKDPWNPSGAVVTDYPVSVVRGNFPDTMIGPGSTIQFGDLRLYLEAQSLAIPKPDGSTEFITPNLATDSIIMDGRTWSFIAVVPTSPGGVDIIYELQVRGSTG